VTLLASDTGGIQFVKISIAIPKLKTFEILCAMAHGGTWSHNPLPKLRFDAPWFSASSFTYIRRVSA